MKFVREHIDRDAEIVRRYNDGASLSGIVDVLLNEHGIICTRGLVSGAIYRARKRGEITREKVKTGWLLRRPARKPDEVLASVSDPARQEPRGCRWIDGDPLKPGWVYCQDRQAVGSSYCPDHLVRTLRTIEEYRATKAAWHAAQAAR